MKPSTRLLIPAVLSLVAAACGASPLAPTAPAAPAQALQAPAEPLAPVPAPAPPTEAPAVPAPTEPADDETVIPLEHLPIRATVTEAYWFNGGAAVLAGTFDVSFADGVLTFGPLTLRAAELEGDYLARDNGVTVNVRVRAGTWSYSGKAGIASGTLDGGR